MDQWLLYYTNKAVVENHEYMILRAICISQPFKKNQFGITEHLDD